MGLTGFVFLALIADPRRLIGATTLMGREEGKSCMTGLGSAFGFFGGEEAGGVKVDNLGDESSRPGTLTVSSREAECNPSPNSEDRVDSTESASELSFCASAAVAASASAFSVTISSSRLPLDMLRELIRRLANADGVRASFSEDISLLVVVSRRALALTASTAPIEPLLSLLSVDRLDGEVMRTSGPSLRSELRSGDEPALSLTGIRVNLICWAARWASASSSLSSLRSLLSSSSICSLLRRLLVAGAGPMVSLLLRPVTTPPSSSSSGHDVMR
jgi:hypothetical protein